MLRRAVLPAAVAIVLFWIAPSAAAQCTAAVTNISPPDSSGFVMVTFDPGAHKHHIFWYFRNMMGHETERGAPFGISVPINCYDGSSPLHIDADNCPRITVPLSGLGTATSVVLTPEEDGDATIVRARVNFAPYTNPNHWKLRTSFYPLNGPRRGDSFLTAYSEDLVIGRYTEPGYVVVTAQSCGQFEGSAKLGVNGVTCDGCPTCCVGDPVRLDNRNLRLTEDDPIAGTSVVPFRRYYDSLRQYPGWFGTGWTSIFDPRLHHVAAVGTAPEAVSLTTEQGTGYVFFAENGTYRQEMPRPDGKAAQLSYDATAGEWTQLDGDGALARVFDSAGKIRRYVDRRTGRATTISFGAGDRPAGAQDSWGAWSWTVTIHPAYPLITSITVDGDPNSTWSYDYDSTALVRVRSPLPLPFTSPERLWRKYIVSGGVPKEVRNGLDHVIETHDMVGRRATSSYGPSGEIQSIVTGATDRVVAPPERLTTVTWLSGAVEKHYLRSIRAEWRVVEKVGGCASCGSSRGAVFVHDLTTADILREQDERGYITENTYFSSGRLQSSKTALRPATCDPETAVDRCRQSVENLRTVSVVPTAVSVTTNYLYADAQWSQKPTEVRTSSVMGGEKVETFTYDSTSGEVLTASVSGWTGEPKRQETRTTATTLYNGTEGAAFVPDDEFFDPAWATLAQPPSSRKSINGPRVNVDTSSTYVDDVTTYVHYPNASAVPARWRGRLAAVRNAAGHITLYGDYDIYGNAGRIIDPNGTETSTTYDALGRPTVTRVKNATGCTDAVPPVCSADVVTSRTYYGAGPLKSEVSARDGVTLYEYDGRGRVSVVSRGPSETDLRERRTTTYDPASGKPSVTATFAREANVWVEKTTETSVYDSEGHLKESVHADTTRVVYAYDVADRLESVRDENHTTPNTKYFYDIASRLKRVEQTLATAAGGKAITSYAYDIAGNLTSVTDPNGNVTTYLYDDFGQMLRQTSPVTGSTTYKYDLTGNVVETTDASGAVTARTYDVLRRVRTATSARGSSTESLEWTYDTGTFGIGRLRSMTDPTGSTTYSYDPRGLLLQETRSIGGTSYTTGYRYDASGNRTKIVYPSGRVVTYGFDYAERPTSAASGATTLVSSASYLPFGPAREIVYGNGTTRTMSYDNRYRLDINKLTAGTNQIASYDYGYDAAGNITSIQDLLEPAYNRTFQYDDLNRLTVANSGSALWGTGSYSYDAMGNLLSSSLGAQTLTAYRRDATPRYNGVAENGVMRYVGYDAAGNERFTGAESFAYNPRNQLSSTGAFRYGYDGRGVRSSTIVEGGCPLSVVSAPGSFSSAGGNGRLDIAALAGCTWTASTTASWLTLGTPGSHSISFTVAPNTDAGVRSTTITVGEHVVTVTQAGTSSTTTGGSDVNANGGAEIIARGSRTGEVVIRTTNGLAASAATTAWTLADLQWKLVGSGDFDGDRDSDLLWRHGWSGEVAIHVMQNGALAANPATVYTEADRFWRVAAVGDVNGDGKADILARNEATGAVVERIMNGTSVVSQTTVLTEPDVTWRIVAAADFDGDARADLLWRNGRTGAVQVQLRAGAVFGARTAAFTRADLARVIAGVGDVDLDGKADVLMHDLRSGALEIAYRNGGAATTALRTEPVLWHIAQMADYDGNGTADVLWRESRSGALKASLLQSGAIVLTANIVASSDRALRMPNPVRSWAAQAGPWTDTLGDGRSDIIWRNSTTGDVAVWQMNGASVPSNEAIASVPDTQWEPRGTGDFNRDGTADLVWHNPTAGSLVLWYLNGSQLTGWSYLFQNDPTRTGWTVETSADMSGDSEPDLIFRHSTTGTVRIMEQLPTVTAHRTPVEYDIAVTDLNWAIAGVGDFDADGHNDLLWWHRTEGDVAIWLMKSGGILQGSVFLKVALPWKPQRVGDVSGDGRADVIWRNSLDGSIAVWEMNGFQISATAIMSSPNGDPSYAAQPIAGDYNGDGYDDVLWRSTNGDLVSWEMASPSNPLLRSFGNVAAEWVVQRLEPKVATTSGSSFAGVTSDADASASATTPNFPWWTPVVRPPFWSAGPARTVVLPQLPGPPFWAPAKGRKGPVPAPPITPPGLGGSSADGTINTGEAGKSPRISATSAGMATDAVSTYTRHSLYTPELNLLAETALTTGTPSTIAHEYIWFAGQPIAQIDVAANAIVYTFTDHLGTPLLQTDITAAVIWRAEYEPYGKVHTYRAGASRHQPLRFPGQEHDALAPERAYNIYRWYRSGWGRYTQADPAHLEGGLNLLGYGADNPLRFVDPLGLWCGDAATDRWIPDHIPVLIGKFLGPFGIDLTGPCQAHDACYSTCYADRAECDEKIAEDIMKTCAGRPFLWAVCTQVAAAYQLGVALGGREPYRKAQQGCHTVACRPLKIPRPSPSLANPNQWKGPRI